MHARVGSTAKRCAFVESTLIEGISDISRKLQRLDQWIKVMETAPAVRISGIKDGLLVKPDNPNQGQDTRPATLQRTPKTLSVLWDEYENGVNGKKAAKDFSRGERGKCRAVYSQRKCFGTAC